MPGGRTGGLAGSHGNVTRFACWLRIVVTQAFSAVSYWLPTSIVFIIVRRVLCFVASAFGHPYARVALGVWISRVGVKAAFTGEGR